jgi:CRISPR-associated protein Cmr5
MTSDSVQQPSTLDQRRAQHAWQAVREILRKYPPVERQNKTVPHPKAKDYGSQAKKLPVRIVGSGLGQALAFVRAKNRTPELLQQLGDWVLDKRMHPDSNNEIPSDRALLEVIINGTADTLRRATDEVLAYLQWLNRFAEAEGLTEGDNE